MSLINLLKRVKRNKTVVIVDLWLIMLALISFIIDILFIERHKIGISEIIILCIFVLFVLVLILESHHIPKIYEKVDKCASEISKYDFSLEPKNVYKLLSDSNYLYKDGAIIRNRIIHKTDNYNVTKFDIEFIKDEKTRLLAKFYMYDTKENFKTHILANRSLVLSNLRNLKKDSYANTNLYYDYNDKFDITKMNVEFTSNYYICFKDNKIYFIDFNKKILNLEKNLINEGEFINYVKSEVISFDLIYKELIRLK
jgi:hypothetical protein